MAIHYFNGETDERECVDYGGSSLIHAYMVNPDYTLDKVFIDDMDRQDGMIGRATIDATDDTCEKVRAVNMVGKIPFISGIKYKGVRKGDIVEVIKGRKYNHGDLITVADYYNYKLPYDTVDYIIGANGEKIASHNCKILRVRNQTL